MEQTRKLIRTDKNGTQIYNVTCRCSKCNGTGYLSCYKHVEAGVCFDCNGTGIYETTERVETEEYIAKKEARAEAKEAKRKAEWSVEAELKKMGFGLEIGIVIKKDGTREYGDDYEWLTKHAACKYEKGCSGLLASTGNTLLEGSDYQILPVRWDELLEADYENCRLNWKEKSAAKALKAHTYSYPQKPKYESGFVGVEGEKVELILSLLKIGGYETFFNGRRAYVAVYTFEDNSHNKLVWKTQKGIDCDVGHKFKVKGTVKEHSEYRGEKQTVLTRCKVEAAA